MVAAGATYQSAERVLTLLASFEESRPELSVTDIAQVLGVHKSTASRLAAALERTGFLARSGRRYRLGVEIIRLGTVALRSADIVATMQPAMEKLSQLTGETINLAVPAGPDVLNVAEVPSTYILSSSGGWVGRRTRPHAVANGKVLLAFGALPAPARLERYTEHTITTQDALAARNWTGSAGTASPRRSRNWRRGWSRWPPRCSAPAAAAWRRCRSPGRPTGCRRASCTSWDCSARTADRGRPRARER